MTPQDQAVFVEALAETAPGTLCFTAQDGIDALYMMLKENIIPSYIFVELSMPRMDGISFLKEMKRIHALKDIPVVVHTTSKQPETIAEIQAAGARAIYVRGYSHFGVRHMINLYFNDTIVFVHPN
jgi:CheY-like chemotaxis protein